MGRKHFTEEQIAFALRQHDGGTAVAEIIRKLGISEQTFYRWKKKYAGLIAFSPVMFSTRTPTAEKKIAGETDHQTGPEGAARIQGASST